jgi:hypothetical protein
MQKVLNFDSFMNEEYGFDSSNIREGKTYDPDEIFFLWDDVVDDERKGIERGMTSHKGKKAEVFNFNSAPDKWSSELKSLLKEKGWKHEMSQDGETLWVYESLLNEAYAGTIGEIRFSTKSQAALYNCELTGQFSDGAWENSGPRDHWKFWGDLEGVHKTPTGIFIYPGKYGRKVKDGYNLTSLLQYVGGRMVTIGRLSLMGYDDTFCRECDGLMDIGGDENWAAKPMEKQREMLDRSLKHYEEMANKNSYWAKTYSKMKEIDTDRFLSIRYGIPELKKDLAAIKDVMKTNPIYEK